MIPRLLQVCNVGRIVGGTAACAWTVTRSLPTFHHTVAVLGRVSDETRTAFAHCELQNWSCVSHARVAASKPDVVLLHNTSPARSGTHPPAPTVLYRHSVMPPAKADISLYCSRWLAACCGGSRHQVCYQAVPRPTLPDDACDTRSLRDDLRIGRICTPVKHKWPANVVSFYAELAEQFPRISWEFIGCPMHLQVALHSACNGRATFFPASWSARSRLWQWDALLYHNPHVTESFGRTVAEAMRAGCIPIVDNRGGFCEQVTPDSGYLCGEPVDFARALSQLHSPSHRWKMSQAVRRVADDRFSLAQFAGNLHRHFHNAITAFRAR